MIRLFTCLFLLVNLVCTNNALSQQITILYFTDAHEIAPVQDRMGERGGFARLKTIVDRVKAENPNTMVAFGGDLAGGVLFGAIFHGFPVVEACNRLPLDVANFGQHDFDFGSDVTRALIDSSDFPWITSNLVEESGEPFNNLSNIAIFEWYGIRVGFLGLTDAMNTTTQEGIVFQRDLVESAREAVQKLDAINSDIIVALTQTGLETNELLLTEIPEIDAIFSEERAETRSMVHVAGERPILTPCGNIGSLARLDIEKVDGDYRISYRFHAITPDIPSDPEMAALENHYMTLLEETLSETLAVLETPLEAGMYGDSRSRWRECNAGNLIADAYRNVHNADVGLMNGGGIRANALGTEMTLREATAMLPFSNRVSLARINGSLLRQALEHGVSEVERHAGRFLQVSGMSYAYNSDAPAGSRISNVLVNGNLLDETAVYTVALPSHILHGGDGFSMLADSPDIEILIDGFDAPVDVDVFAEYCRRHGSINAGMEGRITVLSDD